MQEIEFLKKKGFYPYNCVENFEKFIDPGCLLDDCGKIM